MIYRNTRPHPISLFNSNTNQSYMIGAYCFTPDLPEEFARRYGDVLVPVKSNETESDILKSETKKVNSKDKFFNYDWTSWWKLFD